MSQGQEGDTRRFRPETNSDFSESKAAFQQKQAKPVRCSVCKQIILGVQFDGACFRCHNEPL